MKKSCLGQKWYGPKVVIVVLSTAWWVVFSLVCARFSPASFPRGWIWRNYWGLVLLMSILVSFLLVGTWIHIRRGHRHSSQRPSCPAVHFPSRGRACWGLLIFPQFLFWGRNYALFMRVWLCTLGFCRMQVAEREPTMMHVQWVPLSGHVGRIAGKNTLRPRFLP